MGSKLVTRPMISEVNVSTNETIIREMNDEEYAQYLIGVESLKSAE